MNASVVTLILATTLLFAVAAPAQTTFTYQGQLDSSGQPHDGIVGMDFRLYALSSGGTPLAAQLGNSVQVDQGLFQIDLDFGDQPYGNGLWLDITVNGQALSPRQQLTSSPFSIRSGHAVTANTSSTAASADTANSLAGDINRLVPIAALYVQGSAYSNLTFRDPVTGPPVVATESWGWSVDFPLSGNHIGLNAICTSMNDDTPVGSSFNAATGRFYIYADVRPFRVFCTFYKV